MGVIVEPTLNVEPLLELCAALRLIDVCNKVVDPGFDGTVHLVVPCVGLLERDRRVTGRSHRIHRIEFTATASVQNAPHPSGAQKTTVGYRKACSSSAKPTVPRYSRKSSNCSASLGTSVAR